MACTICHGPSFPELPTEKKTKGSWKNTGGETTSGGSDGGKHEGSGSGRSKKAASVLKVLKNCIAFTDVRMNEGDEAGILFMEMLKGLGAIVERES